MWRSSAAARSSSIDKVIRCIPVPPLAALSQSMHNYQKVHTKSLLCLALLTVGETARAQNADPGIIGASTALPAITVIAPRALEAEPTDAASEKRISGETLNTRPLVRPGDMLEAAPGLAVTQHSGEGKANQYFLRGMNLDHGTTSPSGSTACRSTCAP